MAIQLKRKHFYLLERHYTTLAVATLPAFARLRVTPNQVTSANLLNGLLIFGLIATGVGWSLWKTRGEGTPEIH